MRARATATNLLIFFPLFLPSIEITWYGMVASTGEHRWYMCMCTTFSRVIDRVIVISDSIVVHSMCIDLLHTYSEYYI
jgi:hypothetical protein